VDEGFLEAVIHKRAPLLARFVGRLCQTPVSGHIVLGCRLRPFSIWHQQLLQGIDSPFLSVEPPPPPNSIQLFKSLYLAREICRLSPPRIPARGTNWRAILRRKLAVFRWYLLPGFRRPIGARYLSLLIEAAKLRAYLNDYSSRPIAAPTKESRPVQSPVSLYEISLYRRFHPELSDAAVWKLSPGEIAWFNTAGQEASGASIEIMTEARLRARRRAQQKAEARSKCDGNGNGAVQNGR
jgi:hypothetical protein